jgi:hypothetical protein
LFASYRLILFCPGYLIYSVEAWRIVRVRRFWVQGWGQKQHGRPQNLRRLADFAKLFYAFCQESCYNERMRNLFTAFLLLLGCLLIAPPPLWAQRVNVQRGLLSVDLREVSLISVAKDIERQSGISFKGDESLLEERISVAFEDLPMEQGIKRLFSTLNYSLLFDSRGEISEIIIMSEGSMPAPSQPQLRRAPVRPAQQRPVLRRPSATSPLVSGERRAPAPTRSRTTIPRSTPQRPVQAASSAPQAPADSNLPEPFRSIESPPSPGGAVESDGPLHPAFRVIESAEPPAVKVKSTREIPQPVSIEKSDTPKEEQSSKEEGESSPPQN